MMNGSELKEEAFRLVAYLTSVDSQIEYAKETYEVPIRADIASDPRLKDYPLIAQTAALNSRGVPNPALHEKYPEIEDKLFDAMQATLSGAKTAKQALDDVAAEGNKIVSNWLSRRASRSK